MSLGIPGGTNQGYCYVRAERSIQRRTHIFPKAWQAAAELGNTDVGMEAEAEVEADASRGLDAGKP